MSFFYGKVQNKHSILFCTFFAYNGILSERQGFKEGNRFQMLLGVTSSGKTFTMANEFLLRNNESPEIVCIKNVNGEVAKFNVCEQYFLWVTMDQ